MLKIATDSAQKPMLPADFTERFHQLCPSALLPAALQSFEDAKLTSFRLNTLRDSEAVLQKLRDAGLEFEAVDWAHKNSVQAFQLSSQMREKLTHSSAAEQGDIYIQSLSSMLAPIILQPESKDWVLDLAAAPGGKTILMAEMMENQGQISAVEPVRNRFFRLKANVERLGISNTRFYMKDGRAVGRLKPDSFDKVMLDAPCSSESRFRSNDEKSYQHWNLKKVAESAKKQKRLILSGFDALKPGGMMVYCTCSFSPEENELIVNHLLKKREQARMKPIPVEIDTMTPGLTEWQNKALHPDCALSRRIWPDIQMDGFFLALIEKI
jgi:tRNA (cytosine49-C5)-methyltransferase